MFKQLTKLRVPFQNTIQRNYASNKSISISLGDNPYKLHGIQDEGPRKVSEVNREMLLDLFKQMNLIRRVEISCDVAYKARNIRGFLHLYNGQEAVAVGFDHVLTPKDHVITAYRCHGWLLTNRCGNTAKEVLAELMGKKDGVSHGKGGSMHMYNVKNRFHGGNGIVGAQVPLGTGLAFSEKYLKTGNVSLSVFGDGAANQGQVYESFNMAQVYKLPAIYLVENNRYAMGTPIEKASATPDFYQRGDYVPGIQYDGMNILQSIEVAKYAVNHAKTKGPILIEALTYRYYGHSMSDPGTTYRNKQEVDEVRINQDPILKVHLMLTENGLATEEELKTITNEIKDHVNEAAKQAIAAPEPGPEDLYTDIYVEPTPVRAIELVNSYFPK